MAAAEHATIRGALASLSGSANLSSYGWGVLNQGNSSTCWAHSLTTALYRRRNVLYRTKAQGASPILQSPLYFAQTVYATSRAATNPEALPPLLDQGAQLDDADQCAAQWGSVPFQGDQQGGGTDVPATSDATGTPIPIPELTVHNAEIGAVVPFAGEYDIAPNSAAPRTVAACLDQKISTWIGGPVSSALDNLQAGQLEQPCSETDAEGGHAREIVGYRTNASGELEFLIQNSWGVQWCEAGYSWASAGVITGGWSLLPFQVNA
jgi:hypothetical protein